MQPNYIVWICFYYVFVFGLFRLPQAQLTCIVSVFDENYFYSIYLFRHPVFFFAHVASKEISCFGKHIQYVTGHLKSNSDYRSDRRWVLYLKSQCYDDSCYYSTSVSGRTSWQKVKSREIPGIQFIWKKNQCRTLFYIKVNEETCKMNWEIVVKCYFGHVRSKYLYTEDCSWNVYLSCCNAILRFYVKYFLQFRECNLFFRKQHL